MSRILVVGMTFIVVGAMGCGGKHETQPVYSACSRIGGLDRIVITRQDPSSGARYQVTLMSPGEDSALPVSTPANWSVESATADCSCQPQTGSVTANGGNGSISWQLGPSSIPSAVSIHATISFPSGTSWLSQSVRLDADGISVTSICSP